MVKGTPPVLTIKAAEANVALVVQCSAGEEKLEWQTGDVPMGEERSFPLAFEDASVRSAECGIFARMANGLAEKKAITVSWTVTPPKAESEQPDATDTDADAPPTEEPKATE